MNLKVLMILCCSSLIGLFVPLKTTAQIKSIPDSIIVIRDQSENIGYLFPKKFAIEYLNLKQQVLPQANNLIDSLEFLAGQKDSLIANLQLQNGKLRQVVQNDTLAIKIQQETLNATEETLEKIRRRISLWKISVGALSVLGFVVGLALGK